MCGFLGECSVNLLDEAVFKKLLSLSFKRGPDSHGTYKIDGQVQLGFNRLSIIDLSANGNQPYHSPGQNFSFVFNGEIYNCEALISKFSLDKTKFRSSSDTEVIAHLLEKTSIENIAKELNGMFAISVYDKARKTLSLLRDFAGIKPLFYGLHSSGIVFASQFDQVQKHPSINKELNINAEVLKEYFALGYMQAPNTIYKSIYQSEPGSIVSYSLTDKKISIENCMRFKYKHNPSFKETSVKTIDKGDKILNDVIKRQLISDVPTGTFLSGGIDSPIITAIASKQKKDIESFTVKIEDEKINESEIAKQYANHLGIKNIVAQFSNDDIVKLINEHFKAYTEPFGDYSSIPTFLICKLAQRNFKVLLSGDGGDELFWGYPRFYNVFKHISWFALPLFLRKTIAKVQRKLGKKISYGIELDSIGNWVLDQQTHNNLKTVDTFFKSATAISKELKNYYNYTGSLKNEDLMQWLRWNEYYCHMQRVLIKVDRASMGNSLEVRVPFLDKEIVDYAFTVSPDLENKNPKYILKKIIERYFPASLINKKKMGFTIDIETILKSHCKEDFIRLLKSDKIIGKEILDMPAIDEYVKSYFLNTHNNSWGVWIIYAYLKWSDIHN